MGFIVLAHAGVATADFPLIAVSVLEKNGVIARSVFVAILGAFDVLRAGLTDDRAEVVDFCFRIRPKGEAVGVAAVVRFLVQTNEGRRLALTLGVVGDLRFRDADLRETQRRKEYVVKFPGFRKVGDAKVNVIEAVDTHDAVRNKHPPPPLATVDRTLQEALPANKRGGERKSFAASKIGKQEKGI